MANIPDWAADSSPAVPSWAVEDVPDWAQDTPQPKTGFAQLGSELVESWRTLKTSGHGVEFKRAQQQYLDTEGELKVARHSGDQTRIDELETMSMLAKQEAARSAQSIQGLQQESKANFTARPVITAINQASDMGEAWNAFLTDPLGAVVGATAMSAAQMAPMVAAAALGGPVLGIAGMGLTSLGQEFGSAFAEYASERQIPPEKYVEFYSNPENLRAATEKGYKRGIAIGLFDAASGGIASKTLAPFAKTAVGKVVQNMAVQLPIQAGMGAAGEAAGQLWDEGEVKAGPVLLEALGELGGAPIEVLSLRSQIKDAQAKEDAAGGLAVADAILSEQAARKEEASRLRGQRAQARAAAEGRPIIGQQYGGRAATIDDTPTEWGDKVGRTSLRLEGEPEPAEIDQPVTAGLGRVKTKEPGRQGTLIQYQDDWRPGGDAYTQAPPTTTASGTPTGPDTTGETGAQPERQPVVVVPADPESQLLYEPLSYFPDLSQLAPTADEDGMLYKAGDRPVDPKEAFVRTSVMYDDPDGNARVGKVIAIARRKENADYAGKAYWVQPYPRPGETTPPPPRLVLKSLIHTAFLNYVNTDKPAKLLALESVVDVENYVDILDLLVQRSLIKKEHAAEIIYGLLNHSSFYGYDQSRVFKLPATLANADGDINIDQTLKHIILTAEIRQARPDLAALAAKLRGLVNEALVARLIPDTHPDVVSGYMNSVANYVAQTHSMQFRASKNSFEVGTFLHELVHALTVRELMRYVHNATPGKIVFQQGHNMDTVPAHVREILQAYRDFVGSHKPIYFKDGTTRVLDKTGIPHYGGVTIFEFISELMTNREFQYSFAKETQSKPAPKGGYQKLFAQLWAAIAHLLGFKTFDEGRWLRHVMANMMELMYAQSESEKKNPVTLLQDLQRAYPRETWMDRYNKIGSGVWSQAEDITKAAQKIAAEGVHPFNQTPIGQAIDWIPPDPDPTEDALFTELAQEQDGPSWVNGYPGALQAAEIRKSKLIKAIYRLMDNAKKRAARWDREFIKPLEHEWVKILRNPDHTRLMHGVFMREVRANRRFTADELARILPPKLVQPYNDFRVTLDEAMKLQNEALVAMGLKEVTPMEAYASSRWQGPWRTVIRNKDGKVVWAIAETTKPAAERAKKWVLTMDPSLVAEKVTYRSFRSNDSTLEAGYREMLALLDQEDPNTQIIHNAWLQAITGDTENVAGQEKHFERKYGARGFRGDRPWAMSHRDRQDLFGEQFKYLKGASQWAHMQLPVHKAKLILNDKRLAHLENNIAYAKEYIRNHLGFGTAETIDRLENSIASFYSRVPGLPAGLGETLLGTTKSLFYLTVLGWSIPYTIYALIQPSLSVGRHARLTTEGHNHNVAKTVAGAIYDGALFFLYHAVKRGVVDKTTDPDLMKLDKIRNSMTETGQKALEYLDVNGVIDINPLSDINDLKVPQSIHTARQYAGYLMLAAEQLSRAMAFMSFAHHLNQSKQPNIGWGDVMMWSEDATKDTMVDYRPTERAMMFQKLGLTGNALSTLNTFKLNWMAQVWKYGKMGFKEGKWRPFIMQMGMYLTLSGAIGAIGMDDAEDLWENFKGLLPDEEWNEVKDFSPKMWAMQNLSDWVTWGPVGVLSGTNIPTRGSLGDVIPVWPFESTFGESIDRIFPFVGQGINMANAVLTSLKPSATPDEKKAAIYKGLPTALKGPFDVAFMQDQNLAVSTADPSLGLYERDTGDTVKRLLGLRSIKEAEFMEGRRKKDNVDTQIENRLKKASQRFVEYALKGDARAQEQLDKFVLLGGDPVNLVSSGRLSRSAIRRYTDYATQQMLKAKGGTRAGWENVVRYFEYYAPAQ